MALANTAVAYGSVAKTLHWLTVLLIVALIPSGLVANRLPFTTAESIALKVQLFSLHKTLGVTLFALAVVRILWALLQPKPGLLNADRPLESLAAETVHWLLYGSLVLVPVTGWITHAATSGLAPILWPLSQNLPLVPESEALARTAGTLHVVLERVLLVALALHVAGALKHHFFDRDDTLRRMLPGRTAPTLRDIGHRHRLLAPMLALLAWAAALAAAVAMGLFADPPAAAAAAAPASDEVPALQAASPWVVEDGTLALSIRQLGTDISGSFTRWTADIRFDDHPVAPAPGSVTVTVDIASLALGTVTRQALGADFLDAAIHPEAVWRATIGPPEDGIYTAAGTLALNGREAAVDLPFTLRLDGDRAIVEGRTTLDRRTFGIGANIGDEKTLGFPVDLSVRLTARKVADADQ